MKKIIFLIPMLMAVVIATNAQESTVLSQKVTPDGLGDNSIAFAYFSNNEVFTYRGYSVMSTVGKIASLNVSPTGLEYSILYQGSSKKGLKLLIASAIKEETIVARPKFEDGLLSTFFSPDGRVLLVSDNKGFIHSLDTRKYREIKHIEASFNVNLMKISQDGKFLAMSDGAHLLEVRSAETDKVRLSLKFDENVNDFVFSSDGELFAVSKSDGTAVFYDTQNFQAVKTIGDLGLAKKIFFNTDSKYVIVQTSPEAVSIINKYNVADRQDVNLKYPDIESMTWLKSTVSDDFWVAGISKDDLIFSRLNSFFKPNYTKYVEDQIQGKLDEWLKIMPGESLEQYKLRVTDESRARQTALFEEEIATHLAEGVLESSVVSLGNYYQENGLLSLEFSTMPAIYLAVPSEQVSDFTDVKKLEFKNAKYCMTEKDGFELVYVEVVNKSTGASYVYDNRERKSLEYLKDDSKFVPLELIRSNEMESLKLQEIKEEVIARAQQENSISNHTNISVNTNVKPDIDSEGKKILNLNVGISYDVEAGFSAKEDFAPGHYLIEESGAATAMVEIIKKALETNFAKYVKEGKKVKIVITGMADNLPISKAIPYLEQYGRFENEPVYEKGLTAISVSSESGITQNNQLAFIRAAGVKNYMDKNIPSLSSMRQDYEYRVVLSDGKGGEFRRISVNIIFYDAF